MSFKIAYCAGHWLGNPKGVPTSLGLGDIREWTLNDQVARYLEKAAARYMDVELLRTDDPSGQVSILNENRCAAANRWGADLFLDLHHNGGVGGGTGGGVVAFSFPGSEQGKAYRDAIYNAIIAAGGLKGNRAQPVQEKGFDTLRWTTMPAVLMEYGFMDSKTDAPVIITEAYSQLVAEATMAGIAQVAGLKKQELQEEGYRQVDFIRQVQAAIGAKVDGVAGPETLSKTPTLSWQENSTHPAVAPVQKQLAALGYSQVGSPDGIAGPKFDKAVRAFQSANGCWVDGELTARNKTWRVLLGLE